MTTDWQQFLTEQGANTNNGVIADFGDPAGEGRSALENPVIADLSQNGLIELSGADTREFLQTQLSCDINEVSENSSQLAAWCNPKGRVVINFRVIQVGDIYYLYLPTRDLGEQLGKLQMYILRSDIKMRDISDDLARMGISGENSATLLAATVGAVPTETGASLTSAGLTIVRLPGPGARFLAFGETKAVQSLWLAMATTHRAIGHEAWSLLEVLSAVPAINATTTGGFVPQMLNLQLLGAISFTKGCYPGQEIVARTRYLGKLKKRLYLARNNAETAAQPGDRVYADNCDTKNNAGAIVNAAPHPDGGLVLLLVARIDCAEQGHLRLNSTDGPILELQDLPYSLESE